jgi:AcrR family transcriptional regulator
MQQMPDFNSQLPRQPRAERTIAELFEATAQLLETAPPERLTTNHVAARAGYSIGTLYRYFPSKLALLRAMAAHEVRAQDAKVVTALQGLVPALGAEPVIRIFVRAALHPFAARYRVHAGIRRLLGSTPTPDATPDAPSQVLSLRAAEALSAAPLAGILDVSNETKFTMVHAVSGAIEAALLSKPELISSREFEDQLVGLVLHFFAADRLRGINPAPTNCRRQSK